MTEAVVDLSELAAEQAYFDEAWEQRERKRTVRQSAGLAAGGPQRNASALHRAGQDAADRLGNPSDAVAFGRIDTQDRQLYIGNHAILDEDRRVPLVISWQSRAAAPYYEASVADPKGVLRKRTFDTFGNRIETFEDLVFADLAVRVAEIVNDREPLIEDAVLRDFERVRGSEMRDIVQTIQAAQYELIRAPLDRLLIIQGGPGTGKTAVALHRVSWLLYNHSELADSDVLVVGPNSAFTKYIRNVLPGLGEKSVEHRDLRTLGPQSSSGAEESHDVARLKGEARMAELLRRALAQRIRFPERVDYLDVPWDRGTVRISRAEVEQVLPGMRRLRYMMGRTRLREWIARRVERQTRGSGRVPAQQLDAIVERIWPSLSPQAYLRDLFASRERLIAAAGDDFTASDISRLQRSPAPRVASEPWTDADVALIDFADWLINGSTTTYGHIVVDEAQDLSPMQLKSIKRRSRTGSYTVVGDIAQSTGLWARDSWEEVQAELLGASPAQVSELTLGYRVPRQVFDLAAPLLQVAAPNTRPPDVVREGPHDPICLQVAGTDLYERAVAAAREYAADGYFVGVIAPNEHMHGLIEEFENQEVRHASVSAGSLGSSINVATPAEAKGLEFDAVVLVQPTAIIDGADNEVLGHRLLYVAITRTTRHLTLVLSEGAIANGRFVRSVGDGQAAQEPPASVEEEEHFGMHLPPLLAREPHESPSTPAVHNSGATTSSSPVDVLVRAVAANVAEQIRQTIVPARYSDVVEALRGELGV